MSNSQQSPQFRSGLVALSGPTNAGKSTLLNRLVGEKIAIATPKPQTTRHQIKGVYTDATCQIIFCDTPGFHDHEALFNRELMRIATETLADVDVICLLLDAWDPKWRWLALPALVTLAPKVLVLFNKADTLSLDARETLLRAYRAQHFPFPCQFISAATGEGVEALMETLRSRLPEGPMYYPEDTLTDRNMRFLAAEIIREKCFLVLEQELPYGLAILIDDFKEGRVTDIAATIVVARDSHKGMVIGKGGTILKRIGGLAREELERQLESKVMLRLFVRVEKDWMKNERKIKEFVYREN